MLDDPCLTLTAQYSIVSNYTATRCEDIVMMRFDGVIPNHFDGQGTPYSFKPYFYNNYNRVYYDVHTNKFSGVIPNHIDGNSGSSFLFHGGSRIYYYINSNTFSGVIPNHADGNAGSNFMFFGASRVYTYLRCPSWATGREGKVCFKPF